MSVPSWMPRGAVARRWSLAVLFVSLGWLAAPPGTAATRPLVTGVTNIGEEPLLAFERVRQAGAQFIRIPLYWRGTAPQQQPGNWQPTDPFDPRYAWKASDEDVTRAVQAGLVPVVQVEGAPSWAQRCKTPTVIGDQSLCDPDPAALAAFATAAATRYSGRTPGLPRVQYWQALNEPNLSLFFFPQFDTSGKALSPSLYRTLLNAFYAGVKSVDSSNLVLTAGLGPIAVPPWTIGPLRFTRELLCMRGRRPRPSGGGCDGGVHFDIFAIHPYTTGSPTHEGGPNDVQLGDLGRLQTLLGAADRAGRINGQFPHTPLWVTEFSWDSKPPDPGGLPMRIETRWVAEALHRAWLAGVTHFFWYSLRDAPAEADRPFSETLQSGLYFRGATLEQDQPKAVLGAFRFPFVAYARNGSLSFWGRTPNSRRGKVSIQIRQGGGWRQIAATQADEAGIFHGSVHSGYGSGGSGSVRAAYQDATAMPFSMRPVPDFRHPPFG